MFGIIPGDNNGMESGGPVNVTATGGGSDAITIVYADYAFPLNQYTTSIPAANPNGDKVTFTPPVPLPAGFPAIQSPTGIQVGDLILFSNNLGSAVGEVTGIAPNGANTDISFANGDPLKMNQTGAAAGNIKSIIGGGATTAHPDMGGHLFHRSSRGGDRTAAAPDASSQRTASVSGGRQHYRPDRHLRPV